MARPRTSRLLRLAVVAVALVCLAGCGGSSSSSSRLSMGGSSSSKSARSSGGLPDSVFIEAMSEMGCSFDDIKNISGRKVQTTANGYEIWRGTISFKTQGGPVVTTPWQVTVSVPGSLAAKYDEDTLQNDSQADEHDQSGELNKALKS